jgi:predicted RNase H-like HicB family nuclease
MNSSKEYPASVFRSEDGDGFIAIAPDLPGCSAFGSNQEEALHELQFAIEAWVDAATAAGNKIPPPSNPALETAPSGKCLLRMPRSLHADLIQGAKREGTSLNQHMVFLLTRAATARIVESKFHQLFQTLMVTDYPIRKIARSRAEVSERPKLYAPFDLSVGHIESGTDRIAISH